MARDFSKVCTPRWNWLKSACVSLSISPLWNVVLLPTLSSRRTITQSRTNVVSLSRVVPVRSRLEQVESSESRPINLHTTIWMQPQENNEAKKVSRIIMWRQEVPQEQPSHYEVPRKFLQVSIWIRTESRELLLHWIARCSGLKIETIPIQVWCLKTL